MEGGRQTTFIQGVINSLSHLVTAYDVYICIQLWQRLIHPTIWTRSILPSVVSTLRQKEKSPQTLVYTKVCLASISMEYEKVEPKRQQKEVYNYPKFFSHMCPLYFLMQIDQHVEQTWFVQPQRTIRHPIMKQTEGRQASTRDQLSLARQIFLDHFLISS